MVSIEDMKDCIQEWMAQSTSPTVLSRIYAEIFCELNRQLDICMDCLTEQEE